jgi:hypothetical protein
MAPVSVELTRKVGTLRGRFFAEMTARQGI